MPSMEHSNTLRAVCAKALACLIVLAIVFPSLFCALEADHPCSGDDCAVCHVISQLLQFEQSGASTAPDSLPTPWCASFAFFAILLCLWVFKIETPVSRKVRIND